MIAAYMRAQAGLNEKLFLEFDLVQSLRYGENPHQSAKILPRGEGGALFAGIRQTAQRQGTVLQ